MDLVIDQGLKLDPILIEQAKQAKWLTKALSNYVDSHNDEYLNVEPWTIFRAWQDVRYDKNSRHWGVFLAWQVFYWLPDPSTVDVLYLGPEAKTLGQAYLKAFSPTLTGFQVKMIKDAHLEPIDFCEVISKSNNGSITFFRLVSKSKVYCYDADLAKSVEVGDVVFAHLLPVDEHRSVNLGAGQILPPQAKKEVSELIKSLSQTDKSKVLRFSEIESDILNLYYDLSEKYRLVEP